MIYILARTGSYTQLSLLLAIWLSIAVNAVIDLLGHSRSEKPVRTMLTHSVFTAPVWGGAIGVASILVPLTVLNLPLEWDLTLLSLGLGVLVAITHLVLDVFTQNGIYYGRRRIALTHLSYNNAILNLVFVALGLILVASAFLGF